MFNRCFLIVLTVLVQLTQGLSESSMQWNRGAVSGLGLGGTHQQPLVGGRGAQVPSSFRNRSKGQRHASPKTSHGKFNGEPFPLAMGLGAVTVPSGGAVAEGVNAGNVLASFWASSGVVYILVKAIRRVVPIALEPFTKGAVALTPLQLSAYIATCLGFAYAEGYKGFQLKFAPLVVRRSWTLTLHPSSLKEKWHHVLLGPFYAMGLFHATKKRTIVSWSVSLGVAAIVGVVKRLPYPWRNILDAGVVVGLTWGSVCILAGYVRTLCNGGTMKQDVDPALP